MSLEKQVSTLEQENDYLKAKLEKYNYQKQKSRCVKCSLYSNHGVPVSYGQVALLLIHMQIRIVGTRGRSWLGWGVGGGESLSIIHIWKNMNHIKINVGFGWESSPNGY